MPDFLLPDLGEGLSEAEVIAWRVSPGDRVAVDQVVAEVETAKAVVEVPVPYAGVVATLHAAPGSVVSVGEPLITVTADGAPAGAAGFREPGVAVPEQAPPGGDGGEEASGSVLIGYGTTVAQARTRRGRRRGGAGAAAVPSAAASLVAPEPSGRVAVISPLVRKEARDAGLDLGSLTGSGPDGVVSRRDVRAAIAEQTTRQQAVVVKAVARPAGAAVAASGAGLTGAGERRIPLRGARRAVADKLSRSRREIPEATVWVDVDATGLVETRRAMNAADPGRPVSLLALLARFTVLGLRRYPELNARIERDEIIVPDAVHLGFAAQTDHGLVVPVLPDAHRLTTRELSARLAERTAAARERRLSPADLSGGTFTVNNYGVFGVDGSAAIINHPEVAILGMGRVIDRPWVVNGELTVRKVAELTLSFDHRACDGGTAGGFLRYVADCVESPANALGDM
ncbi:MAG TPA: dihydrolipoamide acetyltransferase family protein [Trebonia sp.]|nr:dihydrolipoamide acetyltransferase family protein [Trebonia sp.]